MELKEIVNLRKLREFVDSTPDDDRCEICPLRGVCTSLEEFRACLASKILGDEDDAHDILYDKISYEVDENENA